MKRILVTGATGNLGRAVATALKTRGINVRAAARDLGKLAPGAGIEPVLFDYTNQATHAAALQDVDGLVLVAPPLDPEAPVKLHPVIDLAKARGVRHIVMISALGVDAVEQAPLRIIERHLMASSVPSTILRPNFFMENFSTGFLAPMIKQGGIFLAAADGKTSFISVVDIAEVAAVAFVKGLAFKEFNLTGPDALDHATVATVISEVSGKAVTYQAIPEEAMFSGLRGTGMPENAVQYVGVLSRAVRAGYMATVTQDVENVTGRKPIAFEAFVRQNAAAWAS
ncbi:MAG: SDR family oxidoreductase [Verrucomicrobia bacterium]|nr:SDR family oxidoreductase [Verrucomicrobiota bacterium]